MKERSIESVLPAFETMEGAGVLVYRTIGSPSLSVLDPFLLLDDFNDPEPESSPGIPWHPHRGFETVTLVVEGGVHHQDKAGGEGHLRAGDVQWMTAGSGIVHQEMPALDAGPLRGIQLWVNLPASHKMISPRYQDMRSEEIPRVQLEGGELRVVSGHFAGVAGAAITHVDISYFDVTLEAGAGLSVPLPEEQQGFVYLLEGAGHFGESRMEGKRRQLLTFGSGGPLCMEISEACRLLVVAGTPLGEPVARYGPFVMNSRGELLQAIRDYEAGVLQRESAS